MKTWEYFIEVHNHLPNDKIRAIHYGLKEQKILQNFLTAWDTTLESSIGKYTLADCIHWRNTEEGYHFWEQQSSVFITNFQKYLGKVIKRPTLFRDRIKDSE